MEDCDENLSAINPFVAEGIITNNTEKANAAAKHLASTVSVDDPFVEGAIAQKSKYTSLQHVNMGIHLKFQWIPGQTGIPGNEQADLTAKDATITSEETSRAVTQCIAYAISSIIQKLKHESFINNQAKFKLVFYREAEK
ncbi:hypothetical protein QYM36_002667, partial [Artemia franciscana]